MKKLKNVNADNRKIGKKYKHKGRVFKLIPEDEKMPCYSCAFCDNCFIELGCVVKIGCMDGGFIFREVNR